MSIRVPLRNMRRLFLLAALIFAPIVCHAQNAACPTVVQGQVWTVAQWNTCLSSLAPLSGATILNSVISAPIITNPTVSGGVYAGGTFNAPTVTPSGGIGAMLAVITTAGAVTPSVAAQEVLVIDKTSPAATSVVLPASTNWPLCPSASVAYCPVYTVKDGAGNAATYPITVTTADAKLIDGASSSVISSNYGSVKYVLNGTGWNVVP
jgi:hypothetical protein